MMRVTRVIIFLVFLITLAGFYSLYKYLRVGLEAQTLQATEEAMVDQVHHLAGILEASLEEGKIQPELLTKGLENAKKHQFEALIYRKKKKKVGTNFYITDSNGIVLHDSNNDKLQGKNFKNRFDILRTLDNRYGARSTRLDENDPNSSVMYVAAPIKHKDTIIGVISVYKAQADVSSFIEGRRRWIIASLWLIGAGIACFTVAVFIWLFRPLGKLTKYARAITDGKRPRYPNLGKGREVNTLGTALKDMLEALEGRNYMENYVQMLTHELKSPLSAIRGAAELLDEDMPREQRQKFLKNIRQETERSQQIIDGLLQLSKLESLRELNTHEHLEIKPIIEQVVAEERLLIQQKQLHLVIETNDKHTFHGEQMTIAAAIANILNNAIQFSESKGSITIRTRETEQHLIIQILDNGPGIPDYALERVFENFYSLARPGENKKSSGLGLAFVREVAELHQGYAKVENREQGGVIATLAIQR